MQGANPYPHMHDIKKKKKRGGTHLITAFGILLMIAIAAAAIFEIVSWIT